MPPPALLSNRPDEDERAEQHLYASCLVYVKRSILSTDLQSSTGIEHREELRRFIDALDGLPPLCEYA